MTEIIFLVEEDSEGGYVARAIDEAIFTEANTLEELPSMVRDAVQCHFNDIYDEIFADDLAAR